MVKDKVVNLFGYKVHVSALTQVAVISILVIIALWALMFSFIPALHDPTHWIRHSLGFVPCH